VGGLPVEFVDLESKVEADLRLGKVIDSSIDLLITALFKI
jgi:hypothetical protein